MSNQNRRIAVIIDTFDEYCQNHILEGLYRAGDQAGFTMVTFPSVSLTSIHSIAKHYQLLRDAITPDNFDGVIVFTGALSEHTSMDTLVDLINKIGLPSVSVAGAGGSCAEVVINNRSGIEKVIDHLIQEHGASRIACITGPKDNDEANDRFQAYCDALKKNHIPIDDLIITEGDFSEEGGVLGIRRLINNGLDFDSVVCADDITAIGAIKELKNQEMFVPSYITVTGFDDIDEASMFSPSITTVRQPFAELGGQAVISLKNFLDSHRRDGRMELQADIIVRESCGCIPEEIRILRESTETGSHGKMKSLSSNSDWFVKRLSATIDLESRKYQRRFGHFDTFQKFLIQSCELLWSYFYEATIDVDNMDHFIHSFTSILSQHSSYSASYDIWEKALTEFYGILSHSSKELSDAMAISRMLQEARVLYISQTSKDIRIASQHLQEKELILHEACEHIMNGRGRVEQISTITRELLNLSITDAFLVLFEQRVEENERKILPKKGLMELLISGGKERQISISNNQFDLQTIVPSDVYSLCRSDNYIFLPLYFREYYFGYLIMSIDKENPKNLYEQLRFHISSTLYLDYLLHEF